MRVCVSRFHEALDLCKTAGCHSDWEELGKACLVHMEVELAIQVYRMSGNVAMVLSLQGIQVQLMFSVRVLKSTAESIEVRVFVWTHSVHVQHLYLYLLSRDTQSLTLILF